MVKVFTLHKSGIIFLTGICLLGLTGCPGPITVHFNETTQVTKQNENVCFYVNNAQDYQPVFIGINPRELPPKEKYYKFSPDLRVADGKLCINKGNCSASLL